jgi:hypothetical protein
MLVFLILIITPIFVIDKAANMYYVGIIARIIMGIWSIFNGLWNACTDYYSIFNNSKYEEDYKSHKWVWWLLILLGVGCLITAYMGYGFNGVKKPI